MWDGVQWDAIGPTAPSAGGGGIGEAPLDGQVYARQSGNWVVVPRAVSLVTTVIYMASQTITIPPKATAAMVYMWGATGGSGGTSNTMSVASGAGGYLEKYLSSLTPGATLTFVQGAGGAAGVIPNGAGGNGGTTTLSSGSQIISTLTCNGSIGTPGGTSGGDILGSPGAGASGGDINIPGQMSAAIPPTPSAYGDISAPVNFYSVGANGVDSNTAVPGNPGNPGGLKITWYMYG